MRSIKVVLGLGFAVALMMSLSVSSASATWDLCANVKLPNGAFIDNRCTTGETQGAWDWKEITSPELVKLLNVAGGKLKLEDMKAATNIECNGEGHGTIGPANGDLITSIKAANCTFITQGSCDATPAPTAEPVHLPWNTELVLVAGATWDLISSSGAGTPGWAVKCTVGGILKVTDTCEGEARTKLKNTTASGTIEAAFEGEASGKAKCSVGGAEQGLLIGAGVIESPSGNAIKFLAP